MKCENLAHIFKKNNFDFFTGVPDSTFKHWMSYLNSNSNKGLTNIIACNECEATAIASGYHLATKKFGVVYMQNSGLGKAVNPLTSLTDPEVYSIPLLLMIGWRGEPNQKDEPQHKKMGNITLPLLETLEIPYDILPDNLDDVSDIIQKANKYMSKNNAPYAIIIKRSIIEPFKIKEQQISNYEMTRETAIKIIIDRLGKNQVIISTTGKTSRELYEARIERKELPRDFYTVGSMGCASSIGLGFSINSDIKTIIIDGDGAAIMQMGAFASIGHYKPENFYHILIDNNCHESTGGQPTVSNTLNFENICLASGYNYTRTIIKENELTSGLDDFLNSKGPAILIIKVKKGSRKNLGRPKTKPTENKKNFMQYHENLKKSYQ